MNYNMYKVFYLFIFSFLMFSIYAADYKTESLHIPIKYENLKLTGVLNIPKSFTKGDPLIVLVPSPQSYNCNEDGLFKIIADSLSSKGIATFRFSNRAFCDSLKIDSKDTDRFTISDGVEDLNCIISTLKNVPRFKNSKIGVLGHSEGGCIAAATVPNNKNIDFLIVLSTPGIKGEYISYNQISAGIDKAFPIMGSFRNIFHRSMFYLPYNISRAKNIEEAKRNAYRDIVEFVENSDMGAKKQLLGENLSAESWAEELVNRYIKPRTFELIRYNPEDYYTRISFFCYSH